MRILDLVARVLVCLVLATSSTSHAGDKCVIGFVDVDVISKEAAASKALHEQFQSKQTELQALLHEKEEELKKKIKELEEKRGVLGTEAFNKQNAEVEEAKKALGDMVMSYRTFLEKNYIRDVTAIGEVSKKVVSDIAAKEKLVAVVAKAAILHPQTLSDYLREVTEEVLQEMDKVMPTFRVAFEGEEELPGYDAKKAGLKKGAAKGSGDKSSKASSSQ